MIGWVLRLFKRSPGPKPEVKELDPKLTARIKAWNRFRAALRAGGIGRNLLKNGRTW